MLKGKRDGNGDPVLSNTCAKRPSKNKINTNRVTSIILVSFYCLQCMFKVNLKVQTNDK